MKKTILKNYLKLGILLFGISFLFINCEKDYIENFQEEIIPKLIVTIVDFSDVESNRKAFSKIEHIINPKNEATKNSKDTITSNEYGFSINTDYVKLIEIGDYHSYTFQVIRKEDNGLFENLVISLNDEGNYDLLIISYDLTENELANLIFGNPIDLTNKITQTIIDDESIVSTLFARDAICITVVTTWCRNGNHPGGYIDGVACPENESSVNSVCTGGGGPGPGPSSNGSDPTSDTTGGNQGSGGASGNNNGTDTTQSNPYSSPTCTDCPEVVDLSAECIKIENMFTNNPTLQQELISLKGNTGASTERGKYKLNSTSLIQSMPVGSNGAVDIPIPTGTQQYEMIAHTHNAPASATYSVFSFDDFIGFYTLLQQGKINTSKFTAFLMTEDGTNYAFTINNPTQFLKVFATKFDPGFDYSTSLNTYKMKDKYYTADEDDPPLIIENSTDNLKDEKIFLDFLKDVNMGLSLFEVNDTFDSYEMVTHNKRTDSIIRQNCN